jgi:DNA-3-methyladenine glycosylase
MDLLRNSIERRFYDRDPIEVAKSLLGKYLVRNSEGQILVGKIVETEAYLPEGDEAAHNFKGETKRNRSLYKEAGHLYVHAMRHHFLMDIVVQGKGVPGSVLIRAFEPVSGIEQMKRNRKTEEETNIASGPGKVCQALHIKKEQDGIDITSGDGLYLSYSGEEPAPNQIASSSRIGISKAKDKPLRFWIKDNPHISKYTRK